MATRVQVTTGSDDSTSLTSKAATFTTPATAGNLLLAAFGKDKSAGAWGSVPSGWTVLGSQVGASISLYVIGKIATGGETGVTATWSTSGGVTWLTAEYSGVSTADPFGPTLLPAYSDTNRTSLALDPAAAEAAGLALAFLAIDSPATSTGFNVTASGFTRVTTAQLAANLSNPGVALLESGPLTTGQDLASTTFSWTTSDQVAAFLLLINDGAAPALSADVNLSGSGTLSATGRPVQAATVGTSGSGTLTATSQPALAVAAGLSAAGELFATGSPALTRTAALSGSGTLSATTVIPGDPVEVDVALSGVGALSATGVPALSAAAALESAGALAAATSAVLIQPVFHTPTVEVSMRMAGRGLFASQPWGLTVYRTAEGWVTRMSPPFDELAAADRVYRGGVPHYISDAEADELLAAGFDVTYEELPL